MGTDSKHVFLAALERTHGRQLRRYFATRMRNEVADISDLTQEVYLRLLRVEDHETIRNPQAYLFTIASHVLHQHSLRRASIPESVEITDLASELQSLPDTDPATQTEIEQRFESLGADLLAHSPRAYATLVLHRCDGIPLQDIARRFGVSYTMVKRYLANALLYCQRYLEEHE